MYYSDFEGHSFGEGDEKVAHLVLIDCRELNVDAYRRVIKQANNRVNKVHIDKSVLK